MAIAVTSVTIWDDDTNTVVHLTCISDGSGAEVGVKKVDIAAVVKNQFGKQPNYFSIEQVRWAIQGFKYVNLSWDRTATPQVSVVLPANGYEDFRGLDRGSRNMQRLAGLIDPGSASGDGKGSVLLTSNGDAAGATYDITLWLAKAQNQS